MPLMTQMTYMTPVMIQYHNRRQYLEDVIANPALHMKLRTISPAHPSAIDKTGSPKYKTLRELPMLGTCLHKQHRNPFRKIHGQ